MIERDVSTAYTFRIYPRAGTSNVYPYSRCEGWAWEDGHVLVWVWHRNGHDEREDLEYADLEACVNDIDNGLGRIFWTDGPPAVYADFKPALWQPKRYDYMRKRFVR
jgi:hypothetical protein